MCSHREGEASAPRALGREQMYEMTWSLFRCTLLWGEPLTESSLLKELNANDIPRYIQTSRIPNSGDGVKCPKNPKIEAVLVGIPTSTSHHSQLILVTQRTSTDQVGDQYWFILPPHIASPKAPIWSKAQPTRKLQERRYRARL